MQLSTSCCSRMRASVVRSGASMSPKRRSMATGGTGGAEMGGAGGEGDEAGPYYLMILDAQDETAQQPQAP